MTSPRRTLAESLLLAALVAGGCALQQAQQAYRDGLQLMSEGRIEAGLAKLEQAAKEAPTSPEYRSALMRQREIAVGQLLAQADALRAGNNIEQADTTTVVYPGMHAVPDAAGNVIVWTAP